jgi:hypothetical protein
MEPAHLQRLVPATGGTQLNRTEPEGFPPFGLDEQGLARVRFPCLEKLSGASSFQLLQTGDLFGGHRFAGTLLRRGVTAGRLPLPVFSRAGLLLSGGETLQLLTRRDRHWRTGAYLSVALPAHPLGQFGTDGSGRKHR